MSKSLVPFFIRMLALAALLAMPFGVGRTAMAHGQGHAAASGHSGHDKPMTAVPGDCAMACASALPACPAAAVKRLLVRPIDHGHPARTNRLHGLILDIATPPPRIA